MILTSFPFTGGCKHCRFSLSLSHILEEMPNVTFALTEHGGHMGFFEGAVLFPQPLTWMDKVIVEYTDAICNWERQQKGCQGTAEPNTHSWLKPSG